MKIEIPDNSTNGDAVVTILKNAPYMSSIRNVGLIEEDTIYIEVGSDWWNAPFKDNK